MKHALADAPQRMSSTRFMALEALCGAYAGWMSACVMIAIAAPHFPEYLMPLEAAREFAKMSELGTLANHTTLWGCLGVLVVAWGLFLAARQINPWLPRLPFTAAPVPAAAWMCLLFWGAFLMAGMGLLFNETGRGERGIDPYAIAIGAACCAASWLFISPQGFAGRFADRALVAATTAAGLLAGLALDLVPVFFVFRLGEGHIESPYALAGLAVATMLLLLAPAMAAGLKLAAWLRLRLESAGAAKAADVQRDYLSTALHGLLFAAAIYAVADCCERAFDFLFRLNVQVWTRSVEPRFDGMLRNVLIVCSIGAAACALGTGLAASLAADGSSWRARARRALAPALLAALLAASLKALHHRAVTRHDWRGGGLTLAAGLSPNPAPRTLIVLGFDKIPTATMRPWPMTVRTYGDWTPIPATEENASALKRYIAGQGRQSRYWIEAVTAIPRIYAVMWNQQRALQALEDIESADFVSGSSLLWQGFRLLWLAKYCPITDANREQLARLSNPGRFSIPKGPATRLAQGWWRFGDLARARQWLETAKRLGASPLDIGDVVLSGEVLLKGIIRGRVSIPGTPLTGVTIGLVRLGEKESTVPTPPMHSEFWRLVDSRPAGTGGSFRFENLTDGRYALMLLLPPAEHATDSTGGDGKAKPVSGSGFPGIITLSSKKPSFDAGVIVLRGVRGTS